MIAALDLDTGRLHYRIRDRKRALLPEKRWLDGALTDLH